MSGIQRRLKRGTLLGASLLLVLMGCRKDKPVPVEELFTTRTLAMNFLQRGQLAEAEAQFGKLIALAPNDPLGHANLGLTLLRQGRFSEAERSLARARELEPTSAETRLMLAKLYALTNRRDRARTLLEELSASDPRNLRAQFALVELDAGDADPAALGRQQRRLDALLVEAPANIAARARLAGVLIRRGEADSAVRQLEEIRRLPPEPPREARVQLDSTIQLLRVGRQTEALRQFEKLEPALALTAPYQAALAEVQWIEGPLSGTPLLSFAPTSLISERGLRDRAAVDSVRFADVTDEAGLLVLPGGSTTPASVPRIVAAATGDIDGDGADDLFLANHTVDGAALVRVFRLRGGFAQDVSASAAPKLPNGAQFATFADYDNDGWLDLFTIVGDAAGRVQLFRNRGDGTFEDVTRRAGIADQPGATAARFLDLDHDGDLDLLLVGSAQRVALRNNLDGTFSDATAQLGLTAAGGARDAAFGDIDGDGRVDLMLAGNEGVRLLLNGGATRFADATARSGLGASGPVERLAIADYDNDGDLDLFVAGRAGGAFWRNDGTGAFTSDARANEGAGAARRRAVVAAEFVDYDNDGWLDLAVAGPAGAAGARGVALLRNRGDGRFEDRSSILPSNVAAGSRLVPADVDDDGDQDLVIAGGSGIVQLLRNDGGNRNMAVRVQLKGLRTGSGKNNDFGIGARLELRAGELYQTRVVTSRLTHFGLGPHLKADVLRVEWTNGVPQTVYLPGSDKDVVELEMLKGSCAFAYTWDGTRFRFVTDVMWRSALGMPLGLMGGASAFAPAGASQEYIRIPGDALKPRDGRYLLQLTEELWETAYADEIKLLAVDHPDSVDLFVDERFVPPGPVDLRLYRATRQRPPRSAVDHRGWDVLDALRHHDDVYVSNLTPLQYQGVVEPHSIVLDLGDEAGSAGSHLFLRGWIYPTDASINVALSQQSKVQVFPPSLEVRDAQGRWVTAIPSLSFPSGKDKTMIIDLAGRFPTKDRHVRIRTSMQIYWDQAFVAHDAVESPVKVTTLAPVSAELHERGFSRVYRKGGRYGPYWFDYDDVTKENPWRPITGAFTRYGDVRPLLEKGDDMYVIMAPGDEATIQFDASSARTLPKGWRRDFLLYSDGWIKDSDLNTAHGTTVGPLPFHAIQSYPYAPGDRYPTTPAHQRYLREYNTRVVTGRVARR